jgi:hypothetical protein
MDNEIINHSLVSPFAAINNYELRNLVGHILSTGDVKLAATLIDSDAWIEEKLKRLRSDAPALNDVESVLTALSYQDLAKSEDLNEAEERCITALGLGAIRQILLSRSLETDEAALELLVLQGLDDVAHALASARQAPRSRLQSLITVFQATKRAGRRPKKDSLVQACELVKSMQIDLEDIPQILHLAHRLNDASHHSIARDLTAQVRRLLESLGASETTLAPTNRAFVQIAVNGQAITEPALLMSASTLHVKERLLLDTNELRWKMGDLNLDDWLGSIASPLTRVLALERVVLSKQAESDRSANSLITQRALNEILSNEPDPIARATGLARIASFSTYDPALAATIWEYAYVLIGAAEDLISTMNREFFGRSKPMDAVNVIILIESLCEIAVQIGPHYGEGVAQSIVEDAHRLALQLDVADELFLAMGETPVVYVEEQVCGCRVASIPRFESRGDALAAVAAGFAALDMWPAAMAVLDEITELRPKQMAAFCVAMHAASHGDSYQTLEIAKAVRPHQLVSTPFGPSFVWVTRYNSDLYSFSGIDSSTFAIGLALLKVVQDGTACDIDHFIKDAVSAVDKFSNELCAVPSSHYELSDTSPNHAVARKAEVHLTLAAARALAGAKRDDEAVAFFARARSLTLLEQGKAGLALADTHVVRALLSSGAPDKALLFASELGRPLLEIECLAQMKGHAPQEGGVSHSARARIHQVVGQLSKENSILWASGNLAAIEVLLRARDRSALTLLEDLGKEIDNTSNHAQRILLTLGAAAAVDAARDLDRTRDAPKLATEFADRLFARALQECEKLVPRWAKIEPYIEIAETMIRTGRRSWAEQIYQGALEEVRLRFVNMAGAHEAARLSVSLARSGFYDQAVALTSTLIHDRRYQPVLMDALACIINVFIRDGELRGAAMLQLCLTDAAKACKSLCQTAVALTESGMIELSHTAFEAAEELLPEVQPASLDEARLHLCAAAAHLRRVDHAARVSSAIVDGGIRAEAGNHIAAVEAKAERWASAALHVRTSDPAEYVVAVSKWIGQKDQNVRSSVEKLLTRIMMTLGWQYETWKLRGMALNRGTRENA